VEKRPNRAYKTEDNYLRQRDRELDLTGNIRNYSTDSTDFTGPAKEFTGYTSAPTDVRKRYMSDFTLLASDSQETP
jgi:hypothetical protein